MQAAEPEQGAGELEQSSKIRGVFVVADEQRAALGQPRQRAFHHPAARGNALLARSQIELLLADATRCGM